MAKFNKAQAIRRFSDRPVLLDPTALSIFEAMSAVEEATTEFCYVTSASDIGGGRPYRVEQGLAYIPINGMLLHKLDLHIDGWMTGYDFIEKSFNKALADSEVRGVVLDVSSHGGEVHGAFETVDAIVAKRGEKPLFAVVDGYAHSAGYALASAADKIFMSKTGSVGSVGVVTMHVNYSEALKNDGVEVTYIYAGKHKIDGNPHQPLGKAAKDRYQNRIEQSYDVFVASVARNRGMSPEAVRATEAGVFSGEEAVKIGFADAVLSPREAITAILSGLPGSQKLKTGAFKMANADLTHEAAAPVATQPVAATSEINAAGDERKRIATILQSAEAAGREELANHLAFDSDMSASAVIALLSKAPKAQTQVKAESAAADYSAFDKAMQLHGSPQVGSADAAAVSEPETEDVAARIMSNYFVATGRKLN